MMNESTVNIADFRGIRELKPRSASATRSTATTSYGFLALESPVHERRELDRIEMSCQPVTSVVFDIGMVREAQRCGHRYMPSTQQGAKVLRFSNASDSNSPTCRGVATWNESCEDPTDCPPAA